MTKRERELLKQKRANGKFGKLGGVPMTTEKCKQCRKKKLAVTNRSGICRSCSRLPKSKKPASHRA